MRCKYYIDKVEIAKDEIVNWQDIQYAISRGNHDGVMRTFTSAFDFSGKTAENLVALYLKDGVKASAEFEVRGTNNNNWIFNSLFSCPLDFSSFTIKENGIVSLNAIDNSLAAIIKAKKSTKYEIPMEELTIPGAKPFVYKGVAMDNMLLFKVGGNSKDDTTSTFTTLDGSQYQKLPVSLADEQIVKDKYLSWKTQPQEAFEWNVKESGSYGFPLGSHTDGDNYMVFSEFADESGLESKSVVTLRLSAKIKLSVEGHHHTEMSMFLCTANHTTGNVVKTAEYDWVSIVKISYDEHEDVWKTADNATVEFHNDMVLMLVAEIPPKSKVTVYSSQIYVTWDAVFDQHELSYTTPDKLLDVLVGKMVDGKQDYIAEIHNWNFSDNYFGTDGDFRLARTLLFPMDSVHRLAKSTMYVSFADFEKWMSSVFGFVHEISGNSIIFCHRNEIFPDYVELDYEYVDIVKSIEHKNEVEYSVDDSCVFSAVKVSYSNAPNEDEFNTRYEPCKNSEYTTGITNSSKTLELSIPWRCSCINMEKEYDSSFNKGDEKETSEGIFFVLAEESGDSWIPDTTPNVIGLKKNGMFNYYFSPVFCLMANQRYISGFMDEIKLASSMIPAITINRVKARKSFSKEADPDFFEKPLFTYGLLKFKTDDVTEPRDFHGLVEVKHNGMTYEGYVDELTAKYEKEENAEYKLIVKSIYHDKN